MDTKRAAKILKALSHPNRLELYLQIAKNQEASFSRGHECFVSDIVDRLNVGAPTISHHLKELTNAELIITERRGKYLAARINEKTVKAVRELLSVKV